MHVMRLHGTPESGRGDGHRWHISLTSSDEALCGAVWAPPPAGSAGFSYAPEADALPHCETCMRVYNDRMLPEAAAQPLV